MKSHYPRRVGLYSAHPYMQLTLQRSGWYALIIKLCVMSGLIINVFGCEEPRSCTSDDDCREGYRCDLKIYVGECVEVVPVVRCGDQLCAAPEVCVRGEVCAIPDNAGQNNAGVQAGEISGTDSIYAGTPLAGAASMGGDAAGAQARSGIEAGAYVSGGMNVESGTSAGMNVGSGMSAGMSAGMTQGGREIIVDMFIDPTGGDPFARDQGGQMCESACDCTPGLACVQGTCQATAAPVYCCEMGEPCPSGEACEYRSGRLDLCATPTCESACDCSAGLSCIQGRCELGDAPLFCCDEGSCPSGMACETRARARSMCPSDACATACDCSAGQRCVDGTCTLQGDPIFCCESSTCPPSAICQSMNGMPSTCSSNDTCISACDCVPGMACVDGTCELGASPIFCCGDDRCPVGERCEPEEGGLLSVCE